MARVKKVRLIVAAIVVVILAMAVCLYRNLTHGWENAYAVWNVADWVIDYMDTHEGQ